MSTAKEAPAKAGDGVAAGCSARSERLLAPALSYIGQFIKAAGEGLWDAETKKDGWIPLVVAENKLGNSMMLERLAKVVDYPPSVLNYSGMKGVPECQAAVAGLMERHMLKGHSVDPNHIVIAAGCSALLDNLFWCISDAGDGILIPAPYYPAFDNDLKAKCSVHPLPFYLEEGEEGAQGAAAIRAQLDAATVAAAARGIAVRGLLVTNPNNPLGTVYRDASITEMIKWCLDNRMHYISDEIYALSLFDPERGTFTSAITLAQQLVPPPTEATKQRGRLASFFSRSRSSASAAADSSSSSSESESDSDDETEVREKKRAARLARRAARAAKQEARKAQAEAAARKAAEDEEARKAAAASAVAVKANGSADGLYSQELVDTYIHMMYGMSKDWCASGLRMGMLYSRNSRLQQALSTASVFTGVSGHTQWAVAQALSDVEWTASFLSTNQQLLKASYDVLVAALEVEKIPFVPAVAGMFVWLDLRKWLPEPKTWESERKFWQLVCDDCHIILTPGHDCHAAQPGFFRLCFAWMPPAALKEAVRRLRNRVLEKDEGSDCVVQ